MERTNKENNYLVRLLRKQPVLQNSELSEADFRELAQSLTFREVHHDKEVYQYHDKPDDYFILINGIVSRQVRNPAIKRWDWAMSIY